MYLHNSKMKSEYWSYLWLVVGFVFLIFSNGIWNIIPIATWLAPVFLIRFLRTQTKIKGLLLFAPVYLTAWIIMLYGVYPGEVKVSLVTASAYGIFFPAFYC